MAKAAIFGPRADHQRHRRRRAVVDVRDPHVERHHAELEGDAGDDEHQAEDEEALVGDVAGEQLQPAASSFSCSVPVAP